MGESDSLDVPGDFPTVARENRLTGCVAAGISSCHEPITTREIRERGLWDVRRNRVVPLIVDEGEK
jgi:adenine deaminase